MPQPGLHAFLALATRRTFSKQPWFALGLVFGALLPDVDSYPQAFTTILGGMDPVQAEASTTEHSPTPCSLPWPWGLPSTSSR